MIDIWYEYITLFRRYDQIYIVIVIISLFQKAFLYIKNLNLNIL